MTNEELLQQYEDGDPSALEQLYKQNIGLIKRIAQKCLIDFGYLPSDRKFSERTAPVAEELRQELFSEGTLAFCEQICSGTYDPSKGKLTTYLYPHIKGTMYRWLERYRDDDIRMDSNCCVPFDEEDDSSIELMDKQSLPVDRIVYQKVCVELLQELFDGLNEKDKSILGHSFGVYGYEKYSLDDLGLKEMLTADGVTKARKNALLHLKRLYKGSKLHVWKQADRLLREWIYL